MVIKNVTRVRRWRIPLLSIAIVAFLMGGGYAAFNLAEQAGAWSANWDIRDRTGASSEWFGNTARYLLIDNEDVDGAGSTLIPVYIMSPNSRENVNSKPPTNMTLRIFSIISKEPASNSASFSYRCSVGGSDTVVRSNIRTSTTAANATMTIPRSCFVYDYEINGWKAYVRARLNSGSNYLGFRLQVTAPTNGYEIIGYSAANGTKGSAIANEARCHGASWGNVATDNCGVFYDYRIPFGPTCDVRSNTTARVVIYDGDNETGGRYNIQYNRLFKVNIYDVTENRRLTLDRGGSETQNGGVATYDFTVQPGHKYELRIDDVYTNNVMQFKLPYDSIYAVARCDWGLVPSVGLNKTESQPDTAGINIDPSVNNSGNGVSSGTNWQLAECIVNPGVSSDAYTRASDNTSNAVTTYNARGALCTQLDSGTRTFSVGDTSLSTTAIKNNRSVGALPIGSRVCYVLSVSPPSPSDSASTWRHSISCVLVVKTPQVRIIGGDLLLGKGTNIAANAQTSVFIRGMTPNEIMYGAGVEYAIAATGTVSGTASGSGYSGGVASSTSICNRSLLTFNNTNATNCSATTPKGVYTVDNMALPDISGALTPSGVALTGTINPSAASIPAGIRSGTGNITIQGGTMPTGKYVVINAPTANVTIDGNLLYNETASMNNLSQIPQLVIIANNIVIRGSVTRVDAWLVATGTDGRINTCSDVAYTAASSLNSGVCSNQLTVNGPVVAKKLYLYRTAGAGPGADVLQPAERFNFRPDAYLWATQLISDSGRLPTMSLTELPPRY